MREHRQCPVCGQGVGQGPREGTVRGVVSDVVEELPGEGEAAELARYLLLLPALKDRRVTVAEAAKLAGMSRRTLARRLRRGGYPLPGRTLNLGRHLASLAVAWLGGGHPGPTKFGWRSRLWPDPFSYSNSLRHYLGVRPTEVWGEHPRRVLELAGLLEAEAPAQREAVG